MLQAVRFGLRSRGGLHSSSETGPRCGAALLRATNRVPAPESQERQRWLSSRYSPCGSSAPLLTGVNGHDLTRIRSPLRVEHFAKPAHRAERVGREDEL